MPSYRIAIMGSTGRGDYGHGLDTVWKEFSNCEVVAVSDPVDTGLAKAIARTGAGKGYSEYREMLDKERPDIVAVCPRWIDQHREMMLACAEYGCHMYLEKPFCRTLEEADDIIRACDMRHLKVAIAHIGRYSPQVAHIKRLIEAGQIGDILEIRSRGKEDHRGGSEDLWVLGTHILDLLRAFGGDPVSCYATISEQKQRATHDQVQPGNEGLGPLVGDRIDAMYRFRTGVMGYFASQRNAGNPHSRYGLRILGTKGVIDHPAGWGRPAYLLNDPNWSGPRHSERWRPISSQGIDQPETLTAFDYAGGNPAVVRDLIDAIEKDRPPQCSLKEGRGTIEMVMAVFESHRQNAPVEMPLRELRHPLVDWAG